MFRLPASLHRWYARPLVCAMLIFGQALPTVATEGGWVAVLRDIEQSVVRLTVTRPEGPGSCSVTVVENGLGLTAAHCVTYDDAFYAVNGKPAWVEKVDRARDIALLRIHAKGLKALRFARESPKMGEEAAIVGYAMGSVQLFAQAGIVANPLELNDQQLILAVEVMPGDSGGAALNTKGELVGLVVAGWLAPPAQLACAVPIEAVREFVKGYVR